MGRQGGEWVIATVRCRWRLLPLETKYGKVLSFRMWYYVVQSTFEENSYENFPTKIERTPSYLVHTHLWGKCCRFSTVSRSRDNCAMPGGSVPLRSSGDIGVMGGAFRTGPWTSAEEQALLALVAQLGAKWSTCSKVLCRSPQSCRHKWNLIVNRLSALNSYLTSILSVNSTTAEPQLAAQHPTAAVLGQVDTLYDECDAVAAPVGESIAVAAAAPSAGMETFQKKPVEAEDERIPKDISAAHGSQRISRPSPAEVMTAASTSLGSSGSLRTQDNSTLTRSKGKRAAVDGMVDGYLRPLQLFLLGEDDGHYCLPGGDTLGTLKNGRLNIRESTIEGAGRGLYANTSFDEGAVVTVYGGELVECSKQRYTAKIQLHLCMRTRAELFVLCTIFYQCNYCGCLPAQVHRAKAVLPPHFFF